MNRILMAEAGAPHGLRGWLRLRSFADPRDGIRQYRDFLFEGADGQRQLTVRDWGKSSGHLIVAFEGVDDREAAEQLRGGNFSVATSQLPAAAEGEYYWHELVGMRVRTHRGVELGEVHHLMQTGAHDVLVVRAGKDIAGKDAEAEERLIPWAREHLSIEVDQAARRISLDWDPEY